MTEAKHNEEDVSEIIAAINRFAKADHSNLPLDIAVKLLQSELRYPTMPSNPTTNSYFDNLSWLSGKDSTRVEIMLEWLAKTGKLSEKELTGVRKIRVLVETTSGQIQFNHYVLSTTSATWLLGFICLIAGIHIGWLVFDDAVGIQHVIQASGAGMALGACANMVLDRSFRFIQMRHKIEKLAPWLVDEVIRA